MPPPADATYTLDEISRASSVPVRTIRYYMAHDALPPPEFHSRHTRYDSAFLVRLRAVAALRRQKLRLPAILPRLAAASSDELLALAGYAVPAPTPAASTGTAAATPHAPSPGDNHAPERPTPLLPPGFVGPYRGAVAPTERWEHIEICPGVKLLLLSEANPEARRVAREILTLFAVPCPGATE